MKKGLFPLLILCLTFFATKALGDVVINEVMASNGTFENGHSYDWVELHNTGSKAVDISGWFLSDSGKDLQKWSFPKGTKIKGDGYITVWCTGEEHDKGSGTQFYAPFAISSAGEKLILSDAEGNEIQKLKIPAQYGCVSYGLGSASGTYGYMEQATRGKKNDKQSCETRSAAPAFITPGGFYNGKVTVFAQAPEGTVVRYTTDGETPGVKSPVFPEKGLELSKTTPVRLKAFAENAVSSETVSATFFINDDPATPIVSLISDDRYLFNTSTGALVKGKGSIPNFSKGFEYPVNIEYFNGEGACEINQMGTFTCSGHSARVNAQKSIALYARKAYGSERFAFDPFPTRDYGSYKSVLLRAANSDTYATRLRDVVASSLAEGEGILYQDHVVIQVYINGKYWGHYNLREKINKYFVAQYEQVTDEKDIDNIDILSRTGTDQFLQNGDNKDWLELCDFCRKKDLNDPENLQYVTDRLDVDSLFTHAAYEIILGNVDFTNVRMYRVPGGKWKYLLFDVEACWRGNEKTPIEYYIKSVKGKVQGFRHEPLNALLNVPEMKARFLNRVAELLRDRFNWPYVESRFNRVTEKLEPILERHIDRWKNMKLSNWKKNMSAIKYYARVRPKQIPGMLKTAMKLTNEEMETYFGEVTEYLEQANARPQ